MGQTLDGDPWIDLYALAQLTQTSTSKLRKLCKQRKLTAGRNPDDKTKAIILFDDRFKEQFPNFDVRAPGQLELGAYVIDGNPPAESSTALVVTPPTAIDVVPDKAIRWLSSHEVAARLGSAKCTPGYLGKVGHLTWRKDPRSHRVTYADDDKLAIQIKRWRSKPLERNYGGRPAAARRTAKAKTAPRTALMKVVEKARSNGKASTEIAAVNRALERANSDARPLERACTELYELTTGTNITRIILEVREKRVTVMRETSEHIHIR